VELGERCVAGANRERLGKAKIGGTGGGGMPATCIRTRLFT